jgi:digeranylgeranylglycerophospholipid reductase
LYDVAVIGGGPIGSYVAGSLADLGYGVVVLEQKEVLGGPVCCTGLIGGECFSRFAVDAGVVLKQVNGASLFSPSGKTFRVWRPQAQAYVLDRAAFNLEMAKAAQHKGAEYVLSSRVEGMQVTDDRAILEVTHQGERLNYEARVAVIASGFDSGLVEKLGLGKIDHFVLGAQAETETNGIDEVEIYFGQGVAPGFFAWLVPISSVAARVGLLAHHNPGLYLRKLISFLAAQGKIASDDVAPSYGGVPLRPLTRTYGERVLVVGTAAGQVKPTTGGGLYYGLLCAEMAADSLRQALELDDLSAGRLADYERQWQGRLGREMRTGQRVRRLYERLSDRQLERIFSAVRADGLVDALLQDGLSFDWHSAGLWWLLRQEAIARAIGMMRIPFRGWSRD